MESLPDIRQARACCSGLSKSFYYPRSLEEALLRRIWRGTWSGTGLAPDRGPPGLLSAPQLLPIFSLTVWGLSMIEHAVFRCCSGWGPPNVALPWLRSASGGACCMSEARGSERYCALLGGVAATWWAPLATRRSERKSSSCRAPLRSLHLCVLPRLCV